MSTITAAHEYPVKANSDFDTSPPYSGSFIPAVWSGKFNAKFYAASTFADVSNTDWEGEIKNQGDKVIINTPPTIVSKRHTVGEDLTYEVPTPNPTELNIDQGEYFAFQADDVLTYQSKPNLIDKFSEDAMEGVRVSIDSNCWYRTFNQGAAANKGAAAGVKSGAYNLGTDAAPITLTKDNVLPLILAMAAALDEQNVPSTDRWLVLDSATRLWLMQSELAAANFTGDATSPTRNGMIGGIDRFTVYVTNQLPRILVAGKAGTAAVWTSGDGTDDDIEAAESSVVCRTILAGHKTALTFASQFTKTETLRNPSQFGDYVRSLNVYGMKCIKGESLVQAVIA